MEAYVNDEIEKTYSISLGGNSVGKKTCQGDKKTPEGTYYTNSKNANSKYHKNLGISYPNSNDVAYAKKAGLSPGGDIKIHGLPNGMEFVGGLHKMFDWTAGCIAVNNSEIDELYELVAIGTVIVIKP